MNSAIKSGGLKELEFLGTSPCISRRGVGVNWLTLVENFIFRGTGDNPVE